MEYLFDRLVIKAEDLCRNDDGSMARIEFQVTKELTIDEPFVAVRMITLTESGWVKIIPWEEGMPHEAFPPHKVVALELHPGSGPNDV